MMTPIPDSVIPEVFNRESGFAGTISPIGTLGDDNLNANWNQKSLVLKLRALKSHLLSARRKDLNKAFHVGIKGFFLCTLWFDCRI
jgi:hypothetical protein